MKKILLFFLLLILTACSPAVVSPPTVTATNTNTPVPTPTITPTATPLPNGPCDSPLLPLAAGNRWTYRVTTENGDVLYDLKSLGIKESGNIIATVEFADHKNNVTVTEPVVCLNGAVENFPLFVISMHFSDYLEKDFNTYHDTGIYAPSYQTLVENDWSMKWDVEYLTEDAVQMKNPMEGESLFVIQSSFINLSFEMDGTREAVAVPAGDYPQALKVLHSFSFPVTLFLSTGPTGGTLTVNTTQWVESYVGLVRAQVDSASMLLYGQELDVPMVSTIELIEFMREEK